MKFFPSLHRLPELMAIENLIEDFGPEARVNTLANIKYHDHNYPIYSITMGSKDPSAPTLGFFGGVHGLERIGSQIIIAFMQTVFQLMRWDESFQERLSKTRLVFVPLINPVGVMLNSRANPNGVDLMRNAPLDATNAGFLYGGHRISPLMPWYRGAEGKPMEIESKALCEAVRKEVFSSSISLTLDVHSGFGAKDRLWFPYAKSREPFPHIAEIFSLKQLFDSTYPHHFYQIEPQARQYLTHGDLWDYLYDEQRISHPDRFFVPLTLEIGSWMWLKKNPRQIFSLLGAFHPMLPHRHQRILRRHVTLFEFLHRSVLSFNRWLPLNDEQKQVYKERAMKVWYEENE